jgi:hypothetical protein
VPVPAARVVVLQGLLVTAPWSSSWVLIKVGLHDRQLGPPGEAGRRYGPAAAVLLPFALRRLARAPIGGATPGWSGARPGRAYPPPRPRARSSDRSVRPILTGHPR